MPDPKLAPAAEWRAVFAESVRLGGYKPDAEALADTLIDGLDDGEIRRMTREVREDNRRLIRLTGRAERVRL